MRILTTIMSVGACVVAVLATSGCDSSTSPPTQVEPGASSGASSTPQWTMPNLVGATLQDAQDQIQKLTGGTVYFTDSHDLSGENRNQVMDANWKVCTQNVDPGAPVTTASRIDFGVVKLEEACP